MSEHETYSLDELINLHNEFISLIKSNKNIDADSIYRKYSKEIIWDCIDTLNIIRINTCDLKVVLSFFNNRIYDILNTRVKNKFMKNITLYYNVTEDKQALSICSSLCDFVFKKKELMKIIKNGKLEFARYVLNKTKLDKLFTMEEIGDMKDFMEERFCVEKHIIDEKLKFIEDFVDARDLYDGISILFDDH